MPRRLRVAAAGYLIVIVFGLGAGVALALDASVGAALVVGALVAGPLLVAFVGERITGIKALSVEISLAEVAVPVETDFTGAVMAVAETGPSGSPELLTSLRSAIQGHSKLLRINLQDDNYWWSTRVFLVAALAKDYTEVEAIVFVRKGEEEVYVGLATPHAIRMRMSTTFPRYESGYRKIRNDLATASPPPDQDQEIDNILMWQWSSSFGPSQEANVKVITGSRELREWLGGDLDRETLPYGPITPLLRYRINARGNRFVALTDRSQLVAIVDRDEIARRTTALELERSLG